MTRRHMLSAALVASLLPVALAGEASRQHVGTGLSAAPRSISGAASGSWHCVAGDAANVHGIGWVGAGTSYTITFESPIALATAAARADLAGNQATTSFGTPDLRFTASTPGSMALLVGGRGQAGCYRYKVEIQQTAASLAPAPVSTALPAITLVKPAKHLIERMAISGDASSAKHCVTGNAAKIHGIGRVQQGDDVRIAFASDFDAVAGVTLVNFAPEQAAYAIDNDSGGNLEPLLRFTASQSGTLALHVGSVGGRPGCYHYQVQVGAAAPAPSPTPAPPGAGPTPPGSGPTPPGSGPVPPGSGPTPPGSGPTPPGSGPTPPGERPPTAPGRCTFSLSRTAVSFSAAESTASITVTTQAGCGWTATGSSFVTLTGGNPGNGTGAVAISVGPNTGTTRVATVTIASQAVTVTQGGTTAPAGGRFDGTYDFSFTRARRASQGGGFDTVVLQRYFIVTNGRISSSDGRVAGSVRDNFGNVEFVTRCEDGTGRQIWTGIMNELAGPKFGQGNYVCTEHPGPPPGGTWRAYNGR